jgi:hypothetical protein
MKSISKSLIAVLALIAIPSIAADGDSPFMIDKREFKKQYKTIALAPVDAVATLKMPDSVARMIEEEVTRHLQKRGYTVLPSTVLGGIRATMAAQIGGVDDPATGQVDPTKYNAVKTHAFRELWFQHEFDISKKIVPNGTAPNRRLRIKAGIAAMPVTLSLPRYPSPYSTGRISSSIRITAVLKSCKHGWMRSSCRSQRKVFSPTKNESGRLRKLRWIQYSQDGFSQELRSVVA